jgi:hypothetical protein
MRHRQPRDAKNTAQRVNSSTDAVSLVARSKQFFELLDCQSGVAHDVEAGFRHDTQSRLGAWPAFAGGRKIGD